MKYFFLLLFFLFNNLAFSQKYDNIWPIGLGYINPTSLNQEISYKIEFNQSVFQQDTIIRNMTVEETFASICDTAGNLQFYTNGIFINDYTHQLMENGDSLGNTDLMNNYNGVNRGLTISDGAIILPHQIAAIYTICFIK